MGQMTPGQARVIDPVLTNVARGWKSQEFVGQNLFPFIPVGQRGGRVIQFGKEAFRLYQTGRAPGGSVSRVDYGYTNRTYGLKQDALAGKVPIELTEEAKAVPGINLGMQAVNSTMRIIQLGLEYQQATLARNAATYGTNNKSTLSGTSQWSDPASTPTKDIEEAKEAIRSAIGMYPNLLILGAPVFTGLKQHSEITDRFKYTSSKSITTDMLAGLWDLENVVVGKSVYADADDNFVNVWGKDAILAYVTPESLQAMGAPSFAYTYRLNGYPIAEEPYYDKDERSWIYPVIQETSPEIVGADAGFLFTDAVG